MDKIVTYQMDSLKNDEMCHYYESQASGLELELSLVVLEYLYIWIPLELIWNIQLQVIKIGLALFPPEKW